MPFAKRRVPDLEGALNFRDMGGYPAAGGRSVRWHVLYRSGSPHAMTPEDLRRLAAHGIRTVCDLRSNAERRHYPNRLSELADVEYWFRDHDRLPGDLQRMIKDPAARGQEIRELMLAIYRDLPYDFRDAYRELFLRLVNNQIPLVFNCSAGKDRTGVAAALLLSALGVPREFIEADYLETRRFFDRSCEFVLSGRNRRLFETIDRSVWEPMMRAEPEYLEALFEQLRSAHGSVENYLREELGVDAPMIERLRSNLLESI